MSDFWLLTGVALLALELWSARSPGSASSAHRKTAAPASVQAPFA
ncbi:hypothetical protein [Solimonas sp. SE-A11]|nr:hypothetical protein [Solimonas sp. SE-A11]MDM4769934.1 hypothetical protein [Solimonas sp. SE-A11]